MANIFDAIDRFAMSPKLAKPIEVAGWLAIFRGSAVVVGGVASLLAFWLS